MEAKLVVVGGEAQVGEYQLNLPTVVGRSRKADLKLGHPLVSRQHCELYEVDGVLMVRDLGSLNGTFVGDARVESEIALEPGDLLTIGSVTFLAVYAGASELPNSALPNSAQTAAAKARPAITAKPTEKPGEIEHTHEASGLAALEQLRHSEHEDDASAIPTEPVEEIDLGWLEEDEPSPEQALQQNQTAESDDAAAPAETAGEEADVDSAIDPAHQAKRADPQGDATRDETRTIRADEVGAGDEKTASAKSSSDDAKSEDEDLDDFFKSLE